MTALASVPAFARGVVRDPRLRLGFEDEGQTDEVVVVIDANSAAHRRFQPFGRVPHYGDEEVPMFRSDAIARRIAARAGHLIPADPAARPGRRRAARRGRSIVDQ